MRRSTVANGRIVLALIGALVAGCAAAPETREIDRFTFVGDVSPRVTTTEAFSGAFQNLAVNESLVVARARDGGGALSQPTVATVSVVEPVLEAQLNNPDLWLERCDVDSDGMLDMHCPELFLALEGNELASRQFVSLQSWYTINANPRSDRDFWGVDAVLNKGEAVGREMPVTLKLLTVNLGNKTFDGDMDLYINIPPNVRLGGIRLASKVVNREGGKEALGVGLMVLGAMVGAYVPPNMADSLMNDYANVDSPAVFEVVEVVGNRARIKASGIELQPEEGVTVEYDALYEVID